jgi:hypothetical protein
MENINNLPPQLTPSSSQAIPARPVQSANQETKKLVEMTQDKPVEMPSTGSKVDLKV